MKISLSMMKLRIEQFFAVIEEEPAVISVAKLDQIETALGFLLFTVKEMNETINLIKEKLNS